MTPNKTPSAFYQCLECGMVILEGNSERCPADQSVLVPVSSIDDPHEGTTLNGKYRIIKCCGSGASGVVYRAQHLALRKDVAIKFLHNHLLDDQEKLERFEKEARTLSNLSHPNIVKVLDFGLHPQPFIVMDFAAGQRLDQVLQTVGPFPVRIAIKVFLQICAGMSVVHKADLVHQDLKPANILVAKLETADPVVLILDFGTARLLDSDTQKTGVIVGSPAYMSPEQCEGRPTDQRSDVYSMGCLMYEVLSGRKVFAASSTEEYIFKHLNQLPQSLAVTNPELKIPEELDRLVGRSLSKQLDFRVGSMDDLAAGLTRVPVTATVTETRAKETPSPLPRVWPGLIAVQIVTLLDIMLMNIDSHDGIYMALALACRNVFVLLVLFVVPYWLLCTYKILRAADPGVSKWKILFLSILAGALLGFIAISPSLAPYFPDWFGIPWLIRVVSLVGIYLVTVRVFAPILRLRLHVGLLLVSLMLLEPIPLSTPLECSLWSWEFLLLYLIRAESPVTVEPVAVRRVVTLVLLATLILTFFEIVWGTNPVRSSERQLGRFIAAYPKDHYWYGQRAHYYLERDKYDLALADASKAVSIYSRYSDAWRSRGKAAAGVYDYATCASSDEQYLSINHNNFAFQIECGQCYAILGRTRKALDAYRAALSGAKNANDKAKAHRACAEQLLRLGETDAALEEAEQAIALNKSYGDALLTKALVLQHLNKYEAALAICDNVSDKFPNSAYDAWCIKADVLSLQGKTAEALKFVDPLEPTTNSLLTKAMVLARSHKFDVAKGAAFLALTGVSTVSEYTPGDCYFTLARVFFAAGDFDKALSFARDAIAMAPEVKDRTDLLRDIEARITR